MKLTATKPELLRAWFRPVTIACSSLRASEVGQQLIFAKDSFRGRLSLAL